MSLTGKTKILCCLAILLVVFAIVGTKLVDQTRKTQNEGMVTIERSEPSRTGPKVIEQERSGDSNREVSSIFDDEDTADLLIYRWQVSIQKGEFGLPEYQDYLEGLESGPFKDQLLVKLAHEAGRKGDLEFTRFLDSMDNGKSKLNAISEYAFKIKGVENVEFLLEWASELEFPEEKVAVSKSIGANLRRLGESDLKSLVLNKSIDNSFKRSLSYSIGVKLTKSGGDISQLRIDEFGQLSDEQWKNVEKGYWKVLPVNQPELAFEALKDGSIPEALRKESAASLFSIYMKDGYKSAFMKANEIGDAKLQAVVQSRVASYWAHSDINDLTKFALSLSETPEGVPQSMVKQIVEKLERLDDHESADSWRKLID